MKQRAMVAVVMSTAVCVGMLGVAWACTGQPQVFSVSPLTAPVGAEVTMRGEAVAVATPVELRWNGVAGPKLAEVTAGADASFALSFTVPEAEPGVYSLVVVTDGAAAVGRTAFEVSGAGAQAADSGFASATEAAGLEGAPTGVGSSAALLAGAGLLAFGSVALVGGVAVATLRGRRALARQPLKASRR